MDTYLLNIRDMVTDDTVIISLRHNEATTNGSNVVVMRTAFTSNCPCIDEFVNTLTKRLDSKRRNGARKLSTVAACVICSDGYTLNHTSIKGITHHDMRAVWNFIETSCVSSSPNLCDWIKRCTDGRSHDGYLTYAESLVSEEKVAVDGHDQLTHVGRNTTVRVVGLLQAVPLYDGATSTRQFTNVMSAVLHDAIALSEVRFHVGHHSLRNIGPTWEQATDTGTQ